MFKKNYVPGINEGSISLILKLKLRVRGYCSLKVCQKTESENKEHI